MAGDGGNKFLRKVVTVYSLHGNMFTKMAHFQKRDKNSLEMFNLTQKTILLKFNYKGTSARRSVQYTI